MWVLILYAWTISANAGGGIAAAQFSTQERCDEAGRLAAKKFDGFQSKIYWVCVPQ